MQIEFDYLYEMLVLLEKYTAKGGKWVTSSFLINDLKGVFNSRAEAGNFDEGWDPNNANVARDFFRRDYIKGKGRRNVYRTKIRGLCGVRSGQIRTADARRAGLQFTGNDLTQCGYAYRITPVGLSYLQKRRAVALSS